MLLTGRTGVGKTTVCERVVALLKERGIGCVGVISKEVRSSNSRYRVGFQFIDIETGDYFQLASINPIPGCSARVGKYFVNVPQVERAARLLEDGKGRAQVLVVDELGPMELKCYRFQQVVQCLLSLNKPIVLTVHRNLASKYPTVLEVNEDNRDTLPTRICDQIVAALQSSGKSL